MEKGECVALYIYNKQKESTQAITQLSGVRTQHGVWTRILEQLRFENLGGLAAKWTLIGVPVIIGLGVLTKKVNALKCWKQKEKNMAVLLASTVSSG